MRKIRFLAVPMLILALGLGCNKRPEEAKKEPAVPEQKVAKKVEVPEKKAVPRPAVVKDKNRLFMITRSQNRNQVIYEARREGNGFDTQDPINVYWIMVEKGGSTEDLNAIEKKSAYGVSVVSATKDKVVFNLKALKDRQIEAVYDPKNQSVKAIMSIDGKPAELESVYINARPRKINPVPEVLNIDITGRSVASGKEVKEVIKP